jgi:hypothetical protein
MDHDCRFFIAGPAIVEIIEDDWPMFRRFGLMRTRVLFPQPEMAEDAFYDIGFINQAYDFHLMAASGTSQGIYLPDFLNELPLALATTSATKPSTQLPK